MVIQFTLNGRFNDNHYNTCTPSQGKITPCLFKVLQSKFQTQKDNFLDLALQQTKNHYKTLKKKGDYLLELYVAK